MKKSTFVALDVSTMTVIAVLLDMFTLKLIDSTLITLSLSLFLVLVVLFRWNYLALIPTVIVGVFDSLIGLNNSLDQVIIYGVGNSFILINLFFFKLCPKIKIKSSYILLSLYVISGFTLVACGRGIVAGIIEFELLNIPQLIFQHLLVILLNMAISVVIMIIAAQVNGFLVDMDEYLIHMSQTIIKEEGNEYD